VKGVTLDAGALIAFDRNDRRVVTILARALERHVSIVIPAGVVGQVWRDGRRQARLARLLGSSNITVEPLDDSRARAAGQLCGVRGTTDVIDASVVLGARARRQPILTSDLADLRRLDPDLRSSCLGEPRLRSLVVVDLSAAGSSPIHGRGCHCANGAIPNLASRAIWRER